MGTEPCAALTAAQAFAYSAAVRRKSAREAHASNSGDRNICYVLSWRRDGDPQSSHWWVAALPENRLHRHSARVICGGTSVFSDRLFSKKPAPPGIPRRLSRAAVSSAVDRLGENLWATAGRSSMTWVPLVKRCPNSRLPRLPMRCSAQRL